MSSHHRKPLGRRPLHLLLPLLIFALLMTAFRPTAEAGETVPDQTKEAGVPLVQQIDIWVDALSRHEGFAEWPTADRKQYPLGPGTHGFVVIFLSGSDQEDRDDKPSLPLHPHLETGDRTDRHDEIGYMVITADPDGQWLLTEYGTGPYPLFSLDTLHRTLVNHGRIEAGADWGTLRREMHWERLYWSSFETTWKVVKGERVDYYDAKTGMKLPLRPEEASLLKKYKPWTALNGTKIEAALQTESFDPYYDMSWAVDDPVNPEDLAGLVNVLDQGKKRLYTVDQYDDKILMPYAVTGYHRWKSGTVYIALGQDGNRYIPAAAIMARGNFFES